MEELSYRASIPISEFKLPPFGLVDQWAAKFPGKQALVVRLSATERESITFGDLKTCTERLAIWFRRLGLVKGDRVGILSVNRLSYSLCDLALNRLGVVIVRLYVTMDSRQELTRSLTKTKCRLFITQSESLPSLRSLIPTIDQHEPNLRLRVEALPELRTVVTFPGEDTSPGCLVLPDYTTLEPTEEELAELHTIQTTHTLSDDCCVYSTSGSTGVPKFVVHSNDSFLRFLPGYLRRCGIREDDVYFTDRPMAHFGGSISPCLFFGVTQVIANPWKTVKASDKPYLSTVFNEEKVSMGVTFPYFMYDLVMSDTGSQSQSDGNKFGEHLRVLLFGGQLSNYEIIKAVKEKLKIPMVNAYGSTEVGEISCSFPDDSLENLAKGPGTNLEIDIKITDDAGKTLPIGQNGYICLRTEREWRYLDDPEKMAAVHDADGFFHLGDMGRLDPDGRLVVLGREDDVISVGTVKIYPAPIEQKLCQHPAIDKAQVFGVPDQRLYEVIGAAILPKSGQSLTEDKVKRFISGSLNENDSMTGQSLAPEFIWIEDSFPLTSSGKVDKKTLRQKCMEKLDLVK